MSLILSGDTGVPVTTVTGTLPVANGGSGVTTSTGTGAVVLGTSPTLTTPVINSATFATVSGTAPIYGCRAWVNFNGSGTVAIRASGNVSSITDLGVGNYRVNFTTAMPDINYSASTQCKLSASWGYVAFERNNKSTSSYVIQTAIYNATTTDADQISVSIFR